MISVEQRAVSYTSTTTTEQLSDTTATTAMSPSSQRQQAGGYSANFASSLPEDFSCPICFLALRDPVQTPCGHRFCRTCIEEQRKRQGSNFSCPEDRTALEMNKLFSDVAWGRKVLSTKVECRNTDGQNVCQWSGELRHLDPHISDCKLARVTCSNPGCDDHMPRRDLQRHLSYICGCSKVSCQYCKETMLRKDYKAHIEKCVKWPVQCVNNCGKDKVPKDSMEEHLKVCPKSILPCSFAKHGCTFEGSAGEREVHSKRNVEKHLTCTLRKMKELEAQLHSANMKLKEQANYWEDIESQLKKANEKVAALEEELRQANKRIEEAQRGVEDANKNVLLIKENLKLDNEKQCTFIWPIKQYRVHLEAAKKSNKEGIVQSQAFYTSQYGYKLQLKAYLNGHDQGKGTHLALFFVIMKGDYDPLLQWPFPHKITLYLLDHRDHEKLSVRDEICPSQVLEENVDCFTKPNPKEERNVGYGNSTFASHLVIDTGAFVRDDSIFVKCVVHMQQT